MEARQLVHRWVEAFHRRDVDGLAALYAADGINHQVAESPVEGREAIRRTADRRSGVKEAGGSTWWIASRVE